MQSNAATTSFVSSKHRLRLRAAWLLAIAGVAHVTLVAAIDDATIRLEHIAGSGWQASDVTASLVLTEGITGATLHVGRATLPGVAEPLRDVDIDCRKLALAGNLINCADAVIRGRLPILGTQRMTGALSYDRRNGAVDMKLRGLTVAKGRADLDARLRDGRWQASLRMDSVALAPLLALARPWMDAPLPFTGDGRMTGNVQIQGRGSGLDHARWTLMLKALTANNEAGTLATDTLSLNTEGEATHERGDWSFSLRASADAGQAYTEPVFLDFGSNALAARTTGRWRGGRLELDRFEVDHADVVKGRGRAVFVPGSETPIESLDLEFEQLKFPGAYNSYLQPFLLDTSFKSMTTSGELSGRLALRDGAPEFIDVRLRDVTADDGQRQFVLQGLNGQLRWRGSREEGDADIEADAGEAKEFSQLSWHSGALLGFELGPAELQFETFGTTVRLSQPARLPVFDGAISLEAFRIRKAGTPQMAFMMDAQIDPISVQLICRAFGWPEFGGKLSGRIAKLRLRDGVLSLGAALTAQVFDGQVQLSDVRIEAPFSDWPRMQAGITLQRLDLEQITGAFSFGRITGRLSGEIAGLDMFNWMPTAFDAKLYTPPGDRSKHRISQRAVQNIGSVGGGGAGVTAALSGGFLKFFEDFNYDRLGISCRLRNDVCEMNGIAPAKTGYYIVKGKGLPRIDVIGNSTRVDWPRLVAQLIAVTESQGPVVQ